MHGLFEELNFAEKSDKAVSDLIEKGLAKYRFDLKWAPCVVSLVNDITSTKIESPEGKFSLADLKCGSWITEMEFFFPLRFITSGMLKDYFRKWGKGYEAADIMQLCSVLDFKPVKGMVRGFIDMVFEHGGRYYIVDWKSNHLGNRVEDYGRDALKRAMVHNLYPLQYLLYTVAVNKYLSVRVSEYSYSSNFGGVLYYFLRGVSPEHGEEFGIFRDIPPVEMIDELTGIPNPVRRIRQLTISFELSPIDRHFSAFIQREAENASPWLGLAVSLASNAVGNGNICLNLADIAGTDILVDDDKQQVPALGDLKEQLTGVGVVGAPGEFKPLILDEDGRFYLYRYWKYERELVRIIMEKATAHCNSLDEALLGEGLQRLFPVNMEEGSDWQKISAVAAVRKQFCVISGGPGTGKTTTVVKIIALLLEQAKGKTLRIALAAPTGKAAARLKESIHTHEREAGLYCRYQTSYS